MLFEKIFHKFLQYFGPPPKVHAIEESTLALLLEMGKSRYPYEYMCLLFAENGVINDVEMLPGSGRKESDWDLSGDAAYLLMDFHPLGKTAVGSAHSHPSPNNEWSQNLMLTPSNTDLATFAESGDVHIIVTNPFDEHSWRAFNRNGEQISLEIVKNETNSGNGYF